MGFLAGLMATAHKPIYQSRLKALVRTILPHLQASDTLLDVGCGNGTLIKAILDHPECPPNMTGRGLERVVRGGEPIEVIGYDGVTIPLEDNAVDVVTIADVLHHEEDPDRLLGECVRVAARAVIVKDHQIKGLFAFPRIKLMDWAANAPYGVPCLFRYLTPDEWADVPRRHGVTLEAEHRSMQLYPPIVDTIFGGSLQYLAVYCTAQSLTGNHESSH